ncbi:type IV secretory system conjugative DNA transfer family protein [Acidisoma cladoniae]|uniref:type IV secretory system conjugative DNA transfer family protein n=1 Tax=Acidisoma cladoniae TaxID=3040935 RepID=UPI002549CE27|nr:type IV secretory system conjugative DNA transfer family protein [Acidisoma sp. PAMC 29798]
MATLYQGTEDDVSHFFHPKGINGVLVGGNLAQPSNNGLWWVPEKGGHALSFGMTRCGKGLQIIGALCQYNGSTLTIDPKGENAWITAERRRQLGQRVVILDPFDEVNRRYGSLVGQKEITTRFNPLSVIDPKSPDFAEDVMMLAEAVIISSGNDPHWSESARALVAGLIAAVIENAPPGQASFRQVRKLLTSTDAELTAAIKILHDRNPNSFAGRNLRRFASGTKEVSSIRSTADTQTFPFESLRLLDSMETDSNAFNFSSLATSRVSVFLVLPVDRLATYGRWLRLIITLAIRAITRARIPPSPPVLFILDEMGTINPGGGLRMVEQAFGLMAGMGIRIWAFLQDLKQLQHDYPNSWETFIANSELIQLLKVNDNTTSQYFSNLIGQKEVVTEHWTEHGQMLDTSYVRQNIKHKHYGYIHQKSAGLEMIMRPDQITQLPAQESVCIFAGGYVYHLRKINYFSDARFRGLYRPNPLFVRRTTTEKSTVKRPTPAAPVKASLPPVNVERVAELGKEAAGKLSGWWKSQRAAAARAAAAREEATQAEKRRAVETAAMDERARYAAMLRDAK